jgi:hypothetical protein
MVNVVFPEIGTKIAEQRSQKGLTNLILQIDNAPCQNSKQATAEIQKLRFSKENKKTTSAMQSESFAM